MAGSDVALIVAAGAEGVAAVATIYLATKTRALARDTKELAIKTADVAVQTAKAADAATDEAAATLQLAEESRLQRDLAWQPLLKAEVQSGLASGDKITLTVKLTNIGRGPALDCVYVARDESNRWCRTFPGHLGADEPVVSRADSGTGEPPWEVLAPLADSDDQTARLMSVLVCSDQFGNRFRFVGPRTEVSRLADTDKPPWATWRP